MKNKYDVDMMWANHVKKVDAAPLNRVHQVINRFSRRVYGIL